ncbi:hypothetical protein QPP40_001100 [Campylobacter upsaliensis]|nr:hypothetical protein [Campylobacter upsaliensis]
MNCFNHNEKVAVGACQNCNVGLCNECITNAFKIDNKPICKPCHLTMVENYIVELKKELSQITLKKIIWSVILAIGCIVLLSPFAEGISFSVEHYLIACFIWAFAGFAERAQKKLEFENTAAGVREKLEENRMYADNIIWIVWIFKFAFFILRGAFFPLFYLNLMLFGSIKLQNELKECEKIKTELNA